MGSFHSTIELQSRENAAIIPQGLAILGVLTVLLVSGYQGLLYNVLGIGRSSVGEALSVPLQQIARTVKIHGVDRDNGDFQILEEVLPNIEQLGEKYNSGISDPVKEGDTFRSREFQKDPLRYGRSWLRLGLRYPNTYIDAALLQSYGYWYPDLDYFNVTPIIVKNDMGLEQNQRFAGLREKLAEEAKRRSENYTWQKRAGIFLNGRKHA